MGDFNGVVHSMERSPEGKSSSRYQDWINEEGLIDLGFVGQPFTWSHGKSVGTRKSA